MQTTITDRDEIVTWMSDFRIDGVSFSQVLNYLTYTTEPLMELQFVANKRLSGKVSLDDEFQTVFESTVAIHTVRLMRMR